MPWISVFDKYPNAALIVFTSGNDMVVQVDIRRKGEGISGGCTFGPFIMGAD